MIFMAQMEQHLIQLIQKYNKKIRIWAEISEVKFQKLHQVV